MVTTTYREPRVNGFPVGRATAPSPDPHDDAGRERGPAPVPLEQAPDVCRALRRLGIPPFTGSPPEASPGRNDNWAGRVADGREVFVKRLNGERRSATTRFDRERGFHTFLTACGVSHLRTPALLAADREALVLVHERLLDATPGSRLAERHEFGEDLAAEAGRLVGLLHAQPAHAVPPVAAVRSGGPLRGWRARSLSSLSLDRYVAGSAAELGVWQLVQHDRRLRAALADLAASSADAARSPGHGDLRLDQFLLASGELYLADWEEFSLADPARDVGGFAGEWLYRAARRMFGEVDLDDAGLVADAHQAFVDNGRRQLAAVRPLVTAFWQGYRAVRGAAADRALAERAVAFAGWHLFDRVFATAVNASRATEVDRAVAGVGRGALLSPAHYVAQVGLVAGDERDAGAGRQQGDAR
jgi:hypothetical protein